MYVPILLFFSNISTLKLMGQSPEDSFERKQYTNFDMNTSHMLSETFIV